MIHNGANAPNSSNITNLHLRNFLFKFGLSAMTLDEVLAKDKGLVRYGNPENSGIYTLDDGRQVKYYQSQPLCWFDYGDQIPLDDIVIKIADFGTAKINALRSGQLSQFVTEAAPEKLPLKQKDVPLDGWAISRQRRRATSAWIDIREAGPSHRRKSPAARRS